MLITRGAAAQALQPGEIIVTNQCRGSVMRVDPVTGGQALISSGGLLASPEGVAVSPDNSYLVVVDDSTEKAIRIEPATGGQTLITDGLKGASGVTFEPSGQLLVSSESQVLRVNPATGQKTLVVDGFPLFGYVNHLTVDTDGSILVPDDRGGVYRVDPATGEVTVIANGPNFVNTGTVRVPPAEPAVLYVGDYGRNGVFRLDRATAALSPLSLGEVGDLNYGGAFALEANGDLVVLRQSGATAVFRVSPSTGTRTLLTSGGELCSSWGIAVVPSVTVHDMTPPVITSEVTGTIGSNGWYVSDVAVTWTVTDPESAVTTQAGCDAVVMTTDTVGSTLTCEASSAGGTSTASVTIKRDATPPNAAATATPPANASGWRRVSVTVMFSGTDLSGGVTCDSQVVITTEGNGQSASGYCYDQAGNRSALASATGINIDKTAPTTSIGLPQNGAIYNRNQAVLAGYTCSDALSGVLSCTGTVANGSPIDTSKKTKNAKFTVTATDKAGNTSKQTITYEVK